jgi:hypothetical protein
MPIFSEEYTSFPYHHTPYLVHKLFAQEFGEISSTRANHFYQNATPCDTRPHPKFGNQILHISNTDTFISTGCNQIVTQILRRLSNDLHMQTLKHHRQLEDHEQPCFCCRYIIIQYIAEYKIQKILTVKITTS